VRRPSRAPGGLARQLDAEAEEFGRLLVRDTALGEALEGRLVAGRDRHVRARLEVDEMRLDDRLGPFREQPRRPQLVAQVVPGGFELIGHAAV
jgi:hypothetical protein